MAFLYPRHFPDIPIFWDDPSWTSDDEAGFLEAKMILEKPAAPMEEKDEDVLFGTGNVPSALGTDAAPPPSSFNTTGDPEEEDDDDDAMDDS